MLLMLVSGMSPSVCEKLLRVCIWLLFKMGRQGLIHLGRLGEGCSPFFKLFLPPLESYIINIIIFNVYNSFTPQFFDVHFAPLF